MFLSYWKHLHSRETVMASSRHVRAPGRLIIWCPFKPLRFKLFWPRIGLVKFISVCTQIADNFWRNYFACVNWSLLALYFQLIQWYLCTHTLAPWAAARLTHLLEQHSHHCNARHEKKCTRICRGKTNFPNMFPAIFTAYCIIYMHQYCRYISKGKCKAVLLQAWSGPEGSRKLRSPDFMKMAQDGGKVVSLTHRPPLPPGNTPGTHLR